ncbi:hypothetical protein [Polyangium aurulentum]|uniref:hypothetical protein n=1 Tax=Polyangium aurulentum TaxID=2567896 RepID=UPI0010AE2927|nr:hypothetical protein [Polyangium aurulentum]UQA64057.1 hypothetical protein E8A73_025495 [Polyangium aurulentum]
MWMKMIAFGSTASILALSACASSGDEYPESGDRMAPEPAVETMAAAEGQFCGGFAGFPCPEGFNCEDDPRDACDPANGGADCGGVCVRTAGGSSEVRERQPNPSACRRHDPTRSYASRNPSVCERLDLLCEEGTQPFVNACGCGCQKVPEVVGQPCGANTCGAGLICCNASCGWCVPEGMACIQIACEQPVAPAL